MTTITVPWLPLASRQAAQVSPSADLPSAILSAQLVVRTPGLAGSQAIWRAIEFSADGATWQHAASGVGRVGGTNKDGTPMEDWYAYCPAETIAGRLKVRARIIPGTVTLGPGNAETFNPLAGAVNFSAEFVIGT